ncbi:unnamed protein product [Mortierella alpina]
MSFAARSAFRQLTRVAAPSARSFSVMARSAAITQVPRAAACKVAFTQTRGVKTMNFGGTDEVVYERADFPPSKLQETFKNDTLTVLGYGPMGRGQALNLRDNKLNVIIGSRKGASWDKAVSEGWVPGKDLFEINEACDRGTVIMNLLSDAAQSKLWNEIKPYLTKGKTLYFSHGFSVIYSEDTGVIPPRTSMSSSSPPRAPVPPSATCSSRAAVSMDPSLFTRTSLARPRSVLSPSVLVSVPATCTRPLSSRRSTLISMVSVEC